MEKITYRKKLKKFLRKYYHSSGTIGVYLAGTNDKKPNGDVRFDAYRELKHPYDKWGASLPSYIKEQDEKASQ
jgi:hypothetical protein|nr:MAG TPA: hypothetical protein [Caudoviricetes sp.]